MEKTAREIVSETLLSSTSIDGRPLPLVGHWNRGQLDGGFDPEYQFNLIKKGHHLLPWFHLPVPGEKWSAQYYEIIKKFKEYNLPISFVGTQWERILSEDRKYFELGSAINPNFINLTGKIEAKVSPFGKHEYWKEVGEIWTNNDLFKYLKNIYPAPPKIIFLSNNEHRKMRWMDAYLSSRFVKDYGLLKTPNEVKKIIGDKWIGLYDQLFNGMKNGLNNAHWENNSIFVGYNAFLTSAYGRWPGWVRYSLNIPGRIEPWAYVWDGASVPYYTHDWNSSTDFTVMSPQIQFMNLVYPKKRAEQVNDNYWFELSIWDGNNYKHPSDKRAYYKSLDQNYNPDRYGGYVKFGMWLMRPRLVREFRGWNDTIKRNEEYFMKIVNAVDDVYREEVLTKFWRFGELVENRQEAHPYQSNIPTELIDKERWYLLTAKSNPPRPWNLETKVNVYSVALKFNEKGKNEWLIYTFSPLESLENIELYLPDYGDINLSSSPRGNFFYLTEDNKTAIKLDI